jgi:SAM-dependent methyltransferase
MRREHMARFWDARARENAFYFINNTLDYRATDAERFWASGEETVEAIQCTLGVKAEAGDTVLDVGCGVGRMTRALARRSREAIGLDVSGEMLARAQEHNADVANVSWVKGDGRSLAPVPDASVDLIMSFVVFQHIPDPEVTLAYVRDMGRVLKPGGRAAFQVSNNPTPHRPASSRAPLRWRLRALGGRNPRGARDPAWLGSMVELGDLRAAAAAGGMDVELVVGEGTQFCMVALRRWRGSSVGGGGVS